MSSRRVIFILKQHVLLGHILKLTIEVISYDSSVLGNGFNNVRQLGVGAEFTS